MYNQEGRFANLKTIGYDRCAKNVKKK